MAGVVLDCVSRVFPGPARAVDRLCLTIHDGERFVLVGPSGCGKTTTLRLIAGLEQATSGEIWIGERRVNETPPHERNVGMVFQGFALYPHLNVSQNLAFGLQSREGASRWQRALCRWVWPRRAELLAQHQRSIEQRVRDVAELLGIEKLLQRMPRELSGGECQRVALGRAIVRRPAVFLFDEPLSNLDARLRIELRREIKRIHQELGTTIIHVTHDQAEAMSLGERIGVMHEGRLEQCGSPREVYDNPVNLFVAGFLGNPAMNLLRGIIRPINADLHFVMVNWSQSLDKVVGERLKPYIGKSMVLGIRPEELQLSRQPAAELGGAGLPAVVNAVDDVGDACWVDLQLVEQQDGVVGGALVSKRPARTMLKPNDRVWVGFDMQRSHVFDPTTGENVTRPRTVEGN